MELRRRDLVLGLAATAATGCREASSDGGDETTDGPMCGFDDATVAPIADGQWDHPCGPIDGGPIDELIAWLAVATKDSLFDGVVDRLAAGLTPEALAAGLYLSEVTQRIGNDEHARLVVPSAHLAARRSTGEHPLLGLMWCVDRNHPEGMTGSICPPPTPAPAEGAIDRLRDAMDAWDEGEADAALVGALRAGELAACREVMIEYGARAHEWIGHTMIEANQAMRALSAAGNRGAEPIFRALLRTMMRKPTTDIAPYEANVERIERLPDSWADGAADAGATLELLAELREGDGERVAALAAQMLTDGVGPQAIWDATRLGAAELTLRFTWPVWAKFTVHAVTSNNALRVAHDLTCDDRLRRLLVLQAVAWLPVHRELVRGYVAAEPLPGWEIDRLEPIGDASTAIETLLDDADVDRRGGVAQALGWLADGGDLGLFRARSLGLCVTHTFEEHELKFPIAAFEEAEAASPDFQPRMWAATLAYGSATVNGRWNGYDEAVAALARLG